MGGYKEWLGREDSNLRMPIPKTGALPLGDAPTLENTGQGRIMPCKYRRFKGFF